MRRTAPVLYPPKLSEPDNRDERREAGRADAERKYSEFKQSPAWVRDSLNFSHILVIRGTEKGKVHPDIERIYNELFRSGHEMRPETKRKRLRDLSCVVANLAWARANDKRLAVSLTPEYHRRLARYHRASPSVVKIIRRMIQLGWVHHHPPSEDAKRVTRVSTDVQTDAFWIVPVQRFVTKFWRLEPVELRNENKWLIPYADTDATRELRDLILRLNQLLRSYRVTYDPGGGRDRLETDLHAVFHNSRFDHGGRLYPSGLSHQAIRRDLRHTITIGGEPCCECDFRAMHPMLMYAQRGIQYDTDRDPYAFHDIEEYPAHREFFKNVTFGVINTKNRHAAAAVLRKKIDEDLEEIDKRIREDFGIFDDGTMPLLPQQQNELRRLLKLVPDLVSKTISAYEKAHHPIRPFFYSMKGFELMNTDARICWRVCEVFVDRGLPILPIHDSFVVRSRDKQLLKETMRDAYREVTGGFDCAIRVEWQATKF